MKVIELKKRGYFKGRVIEVKGSIVVIDTKAEIRRVKTVTGEEIKSAAWKPPDPMPKVGDIVRCIFRVRK